MAIVNIITCPQWGAVAPKQDVVIVAKAREIIFHHTAGHHPEIDTPGSQSRDESMRYARDIQHFHMAPGGLGVPQGGIDSGHNFLVCRNGVVLQGRWLTVSAIQAGLMVESAHCPTRNHQIGIEHEHAGSEQMTKAQREASAKLMAWISAKYGRKTILPVSPHSTYVNTTCPANLDAEIAAIRARAAAILNA